MEKTQIQQKQARQALEAMLGSDLFAYTISLSLAAICVAETSGEPISQRFTDVLRMAIVGELFASGMSNAEASHWFSALMDRVAPFAAEISSAMYAAASETATVRGDAQ